MREDIHIDPSIVDGILKFHFTETEIDFEALKEESSLRYSELLIKALTQEYPDHTGDVAFVGSIETMRYAIIIILDLYEEYLSNLILHDMAPYNFDEE